MGMSTKDGWVNQGVVASEATQSERENAESGSAASTGAQLIDYERARDMAADPDPSIRRTLASRLDTQPEVLFFLAEDRDPSVRLEVARNPSAPRQADILLVKDEDGAIRSGLAEKIARLMPDLPNDRRSTLYRLTVKALEALAEDNLAMVRMVLAECLKGVPNAPHDVVRLLAGDAELAVAQPILEFSPVLSDKDLVEIINSKPVQGAMQAIARREELGESVSDAIVDHGGDDAIAVLLANKSAQIREETLDAMVELAETKSSWHEPIVMRPKLSRRAVLRLSNFVAMTLLDRLQNRLDLDPDALVELTQNVERRLESEAGTTKGEGRTAAALTDSDLSQHVENRVEDRDFRGSDLENALARGDKCFAETVLSVLSEVPEARVADAVSSMNARALVSVVWKTGLSPTYATLVQGQLAGIAPGDILRSDDDDWPLSEQDMEWQVALLLEID